MGEQAPSSQSGSHLPETHDDRAFDTMLRLLIMMEGELQTKEAIIDVLMEGRTKDEVLLNKLNKLLGVRETDPFSALKRDGVYSHQKWSELFAKENERDHAVLADSSRYLSACSSLRAISVARIQNQRYSEAYEMLQKTVKSYKKLKIKYTKERRKSTTELQPHPPPAEVNDVNTTKTAEMLAQAREQLEQEKERCREMEKKVQQLSSKMDDEHRRTMSVEKQMRDEIRRLNRELRQERENAKRNHCRLLITARRVEPEEVTKGLT